MRYLLESGNFSNLKKLMVKYNQIRDIMSLTVCKFCPNIEHFDSQENESGDIGAQIISTCVMKNLKIMNLRHNKIGDAGYKCLSESENLTKLHTLYIYPGNDASMESKKSFIRSTKFLRSLSNVS